MSDAQVLVTRGVSKKFGDFTAVDRVDFDMERQETLGLIGPNGAGKTTFVNLITGFYPADGGSVFLEGKDVTRLSPAKRVALGIARTFQLVHVFDNLSVFENLALSYFRKKEDTSFPIRMIVSTFRESSIVETVRESLEMLELDHLGGELVGNLPLGSKKRLELAMAFASSPKILVLDEPFSGLGDHEINEVVDVLRRYSHDKTILVVEHKVSKLTDFADRLAVMHEGRIICCGKCEDTLKDEEVRRVYWKVT